MRVSKCTVITQIVTIAAWCLAVESQLSGIKKNLYSCLTPILRTGKSAIRSSNADSISFHLYILLPLIDFYGKAGDARGTHKRHSIARTEQSILPSLRQFPALSAQSSSITPTPKRANDK